MSHDDLGDERAGDVTPRAYRPGSWLGVLGGSTSVLLPPAQRHRIAGLWELVDDGAGFEEVLDALVADGLRELPAFVLWGRTPDGLRVLLRGEARVSAATDDGPVEIAGSGAATWLEQTLPAGTALTVVVEDAATGGDDSADLRVDVGLVRLSSLREPADAERDVDPDDGTGADESPLVVAEQPAPEQPAPEYDLAPDPVVAADAEESDQDDDWSHDDSLLTEPIQTLPPEVAREILAPSDPFSPPAPVPDQQPSWGQQPDPGASQPLPQPPQAPWAPSPFPGPPAGAPQAPPAVPVGEQPAGDADHDGMTRSGSWGPDQFVRHHPGIPGQPPAPSVVSRPVARLVISSGDTIEVDRVILVGRAPEARRFTSTEQPRLVTVPSPQKEISSTHLEIRPGSGADHGTAVVTDMGSTNGTVLVQPGLAPEELVPGVAVQLIPGAVLDLGDSVTIQVTRP